MLIIIIYIKLFIIKTKYNWLYFTYLIFFEKIVWTFNLKFSNFSCFIDETIYNVDAYISISNVFEDGTIIESKKYLNLVNYSNYSYISIPEYFYRLNINNLYFVNLTGTILRRVFIEDKWTTINFQFKKYANSTSNNNYCKSPDEITKILNGGYIFIIFCQTIYRFLGIFSNQINKYR